MVSGLIRSGLICTRRHTFKCMQCHLQRSHSFREVAAAKLHQTTSTYGAWGFQRLATARSSLIWCWACRGTTYSCWGPV